MNITLYNTSSEPNRVKKKLNNGYNISANLKEETSILQPSLIISMSNPTVYNYVYITEFSRYYYITEVTSLRNGLWRIDCDVDVLMTYRDDILKLKCIVSRQQNKYDLYLEDPLFKARTYPFVQIKNFSKSIPAISTTSNYILTVAGG